MKSSATLRLIAKDWRLNSRVILLSIMGGAAALGVLTIGGQTSLVLGAGFFFASIAFCAGFLPLSNIVNERKKKTLAFVMSLPVSPAQYGTTKLVSTLGMFLIPWLTLLAAGLYLILGRHILPNGTIPTALILAIVPFVGFCLFTGIALLTESDGAASAVTAAVSSSYWLAWYLIASQAPSLTSTWNSPVAVWNATALDVLGAELAAIVMILVVTRLLQARKRNFI
jgi:ABC-2 type transport system permease protein